MGTDVLPDPPKRVGFFKQMMIGMALMEPPDEFDDLPPDVPRPPQDLDWIVTVPNLEPPVGNPADLPAATPAPVEPDTVPQEQTPVFPPAGMEPPPPVDAAEPTKYTPGTLRLSEYEVQALLTAREKQRDEAELNVRIQQRALDTANDQLEAARNLMALVRGGHPIVVGVPST